MSYEERVELILEIANYILNNETSMRKVALKFKISKTSVSKYMKEDLAKIDPDLYNKVREKIFISGELTEEDKKRIDLEYELYVSGKTLMEISKITGNSYSMIQRDLSDRLKKIDKEKEEQVNEIKYENIRSNEKTLEEKKELLKIIEVEYELIKKGYKLEEIAKLVKRSYSSVQRDLTLLEVIDLDKYNEVINILKNNQKATRINNLTNK